MAEDEHKIHPWEGDSDNQSWQPSHIDSHDNGNTHDSQSDTQPIDRTQELGGQGHDSSIQETQRIGVTPDDVTPSSDAATTQLPSNVADWMNSEDSASSTTDYDNPFVGQGHDHFESSTQPLQAVQPTQASQASDDVQDTQTIHHDDTGQETQAIAPASYQEVGGADAGSTENLSAVADEEPTQESQTPDNTHGSTSAVSQNGSDQRGYSPAPEYGAYAPAYNAQASQQSGDQPSADPQAQPQYGATYQGQFNPYPYGAPEQSPSSHAADDRNTSEQQGQNPQYGAPFGPQYPQGPQSSRGSQGPQPPFSQGPFGPQNGPNGPGPRNGRAQGRNKPANTILVAIIAALVSAALMLGLGWAAISNGLVSLPTSSSLSSLDSSTSGSGSATAKSGEAPDWQAVEKQVSASVVSIETTVSNGVDMGSGAIIDTSGDIVTNNHVITGATKIQVTLSNGQMYSAKTVGTDSTTDLAVIKLDNPPSDLKAVTFADSDSVAVGENIMAIGNPLGYDNTATTGIVSALNRPVSVMDDTSTTIVTNAIQIDAAINPGNSGGPTFNAAGQVVGINSSIASTASSSSTAGSIGIGFAIPSNLVKRVSESIIKDGKVKHVALGVSIQSSTVEADGVTRGGAKIVSVTSGSPADKAGLKTGDVIVAYDGNAVNSNYSVLGFVRASAYGAKATITVVRNGNAQDLTVTLDQEESAVTGKSKTESDSGSSDGSSGGSSDGNSDNDDDGGITDPFGLLNGN